MRNPNKKNSYNTNGGGNGRITSTTPTTTSTSTVTPCCSKIGLKRGPWTPEEDEVLSEYIRKEGEGRWRTLPKRAGLLRCGKSCRLRWMNYLRPNVKRGQIAPDEEDLILRLHRLLGNRWSLIAGRIPGRTDNEIKNYWNTHLSKKLISQGIDPRTHKPLNPSSPSSTTTLPIINNQQNLAVIAPSFVPPVQTVYNKGFEVGPSRDDSSNHLGQFHEYQQQGHDGVGIGNIIVNEIDQEHGHDHDDVSAMNHLLTTTTAGGGGGVNINYNIDATYCCGDDVFTSFLDSLINEDDAFAAHRNHLHSDINDHHQNNIIALPSDHDDHLVSSAPMLGFGLGGGSGVVWEESPLISPAFTQNNDHNNINKLKEVDHDHQQ